RFEFGDERIRWPFAQAAFELRECLRIATGHRFDRAAIGQVAHPAIEPKLTGHPGGEHAKPNALHPPADDVATDGLLHGSMVAVRRAVEQGRACEREGRTAKASTKFTRACTFNCFDLYTSPS